MKKIFSILFLVLITSGVKADQPNEPQFEIIGDSIKYENGDIVSIDDFLTDHPEERYRIEQRKKLQVEIENQKKEKKTEYKFDKTWKFYSLIIIFPVVLLFFVLLVLKSRKKNQNL